MSFKNNLRTYINTYFHQPFIFVFILLQFYPSFLPHLIFYLLLNLKSCDSQLFKHPYKTSSQTEQDGLILLFEVFLQRLVHTSNFNLLYYSSFLGVNFVLNYTLLSLHFFFIWGFGWLNYHRSCYHTVLSQFYLFYISTYILLFPDPDSINKIEFLG